jgi:ribonuclease Z
MNKIFQTYILGCSAATPTSDRHTTAQLLNFHNKYFMLDCSEGAQKQLRRMRLPMMKIDHIFISHLHGDHYLGLAGLLFSYHLLGRTKTLHIYAPEGLQEIIDLQFKVSQHEPAYSIHFHVVYEGGQLVYEDKNLTVETIAMKHRIPTFGYLFREKPALRNMRKDALEHYNIPIEQISNIKSGNDFVRENGEVIPNYKLTKNPPAPRSYAFCSDTGYTEQYVDQIKNVDLLYHEATFLHDKVDIARQKTHCTSIDAATIAKKAGVKQLMLGHYSARYDDMKLFVDEAKSIFQNTILAEEGMCVEVGYTKKP